MSRMSKIHVWIGLTKKNEPDFLKYFDQRNSYIIDPNTGLDRNPELIEYSLFMKDLSYNAQFDEGFFNLYYNNQSDDLKLALEEVQFEVKEDLFEVCKKIGIKSANAMFFYTDSELYVIDKEKKYNDLTYIGTFDSDL